MLVTLARSSIPVFLHRADAQKTIAGDLSFGFPKPEGKVRRLHRLVHRWFNTPPTSSKADGGS